MSDLRQPKAAGIAAIASFWISCVLGGSVAAQDSWEFSPYRVLVWVAIRPDSPLVSHDSTQFAGAVERRAQLVEGAVWALTVAATPDSLAPDQILDETLLTADRLLDAVPQMFSFDKLICLTLAGEPYDYRVRAREFDCRTRHWGPASMLGTPFRSRLPHVSIDAIRQSFAALVRIESGVSNRLTVRIRAGGLIGRATSAAAVATGDVFEPLIRLNDRVGNPTRIERIDWTYLRVTGEDETNPSLAQVTVYSGYRNPIRGRVAANREQYGLAVRPSEPETRIVVHAKALAGGEPYPLSGLEIYLRPPTTAGKPAGDDAKLASRPTPQLIGYTDRAGVVKIPRQDPLLQIAYIKSGGQLLARLPLVVGLHKELVALVPDDEARLQAEANVRGFNARLTDLVAQRRIFAAKIRQHLGERRVAEAEALLEQFTQLPTRRDMLLRFEQRQSQAPESRDPLVQARIDQLYAQTRRTLNKYLDPGLQGMLTREVNAARRALQGSRE